MIDRTALVAELHALADAAPITDEDIDAAATRIQALEHAAVEDRLQRTGRRRGGTTDRWAGIPAPTPVSPRSADTVIRLLEHDHEELHYGTPAADQYGETDITRAHTVKERNQ